MTAPGESNTYEISQIAIILKKLQILHQRYIKNDRDPKHEIEHLNHNSYLILEINSFGTETYWTPI